MLDLCDVNVRLAAAAQKRKALGGWRIRQVDLDVRATGETLGLADQLARTCVQRLHPQIRVALIGGRLRQGINQAPVRAPGHGFAETTVGQSEIKAALVRIANLQRYVSVAIAGMVDVARESEFPTVGRPGWRAKDVPGFADETSISIIVRRGGGFAPTP